MKKGIKTIDQIAETIGMPIDLLKEELTDYFLSEGETLDSLEIEDIVEDYLALYRLSGYLKLLTIDELYRLGNDLTDTDYPIEALEDATKIIAELVDRCKKGGIK